MHEDSGTINGCDLFDLRNVSFENRLFFLFEENEYMCITLRAAYVINVDVCLSAFTWHMRLSQIWFSTIATTITIVQQSKLKRCVMWRSFGWMKLNLPRLRWRELANIFIERRRRKQPKRKTTAESVVGMGRTTVTLTMYGRVWDTASARERFILLLQPKRMLIKTEIFIIFTYFNVLM